MPLYTQGQGTECFDGLYCPLWPCKHQDGRYQHNLQCKIGFEIFGGVVKRQNKAAVIKGWNDGQFSFSLNHQVKSSHQTNISHICALWLQGALPCFTYSSQYLYGQVLTRISIELGSPCSLPKRRGEVPCSILILPFLCPISTLAEIVCTIFPLQYTALSNDVKQSTQQPFDQCYYWLLTGEIDIVRVIMKTILPDDGMSLSDPRC